MSLYLGRGWKSSVTLIDSLHKIAGKIHECLSCNTIAQSYRRSTVAALADTAYERNLCKYLYTKFLGKFHGTVTSENVVTFVGMCRRCEPCHILHDTEHGNIDLVVAEHRQTLAGIGQRHLLGGAHNYSTGDGERLHECKMDIACAGGMSIRK